MQRTHWLGIIATFGVLWAGGPAFGQGSAEDYARADRLPGAWSRLVRNAALAVRWIDAETPVYRFELANGSSEWRTVDLETGEVRRAFDEGAISRALEEAGSPAGETLRLAWFGFDAGGLLFMAEGDPTFWQWSGERGSLTRRDAASLPPGIALPARRVDRTRGGGGRTSVVVVNATDAPVRLDWLDQGGAAREYATVEPGGTHRQGTHVGHVWRVSEPGGGSLGAYIATEEPGLILVRGREEPEAPERREGRGGAWTGGAASPDGGFRVAFRDHQVVLHAPGDDAGRDLTTDGVAGDAYGGRVWWSPDSTRFVVMRTRPGTERTVHVVDSTPDDRLEPRLVSYDYRKPGDDVDVSRPRLFDATTGEAIEIDDAPIENPWSVGGVEWLPDSSGFAYLYNGRGHRSMRYVIVDAATGASRIVVDETSETFIDWTNKVFSHRLDATGELVWMSERSGWNHLYLIDLATGSVKNAITSGEWVVRAVDRVDEESRQVWLRVMGVYPGQDPYHVHYARVNLDGSGFTLLTEGDGTHRVEPSADGRFLVDVWSRVDLAPVTEIRRATDGARVAVLAEGDTSALEAAGWSAPERFVAKGRDGVTDIWGFIQRPTRFDPAHRYPVIESIYAGPHGHHVPKEFGVWRSSRDLAELGFVTVHIDGMGTNWRSKAFHDVAHKNLADAGFPDRIAWMRAAAATRPWMDIGRVGIYGVSAGGQNALGALLFHGDFYDAAVADCGCHDNRMDKIWWNEQWMGWPVDDSYAASSNAEHASNLRGKLLLTVGELDRNVDPASTMQVVDALIRADKDFDLIVFPGLGHGTIGSPYGRRRMRDFFVRNLLGVEPRWSAGEDGSPAGAEGRERRDPRGDTGED